MVIQRYVLEPFLIPLSWTHLLQSIELNQQFDQSIPNLDDVRSPQHPHIYVLLLPQSLSKTAPKVHDDKLSEIQLFFPLMVSDNPRYFS